MMQKEAKEFFRKVKGKRIRWTGWSSQHTYFVPEYLAFSFSNTLWMGGRYFEVTNGKHIPLPTARSICEVRNGFRGCPPPNYRWEIFGDSRYLLFK